MEKEDLKRCSLELAQVMEDIGVNEEMVSFRRHNSLIIDRFMFGLTIEHFTFGSQSEGSTTIGMMSDTDKLVCYETDVACVQLSDCQDSKNNYFVIKEPTSLPQCCCLQPIGRLKNNKYVPMTSDCIYAPDSTDRIFKVDDQGRVLFNSMFYINMALTILDKFNIMRVQHHGPACTAYNSDSVVAIRCPTLPDTCRFMFTKPRPGHWPSQGTLSKAKYCEVYMMPAGFRGHSFGYDDTKKFSFIELHYRKSFIDSQFRMSTNMTERLLMFDINIVQMKAYVVTKMIRKEFLQPLVDDRLSTFHMKTALWFTIEQFPEDIWRDDNLVQCVINCLNTLKRFSKRSYCPHYTISSVNLFAGKLMKNELQIVIEIITAMTKSSLRCLRKLCMDDVGLRLFASSEGIRNEEILSGTEIRLKIIVQMIDKLRDFPYPPFLNPKIIDLKMWALGMKSEVTTDHEYKNELEFLLQSMCNRLASQEASDCIANVREVTSDIISMYETSLRSKDISNHLRYASMLVCTRQFERAFALLHTIENRINVGMMQYSELSKQSSYVKPKSDERSSKRTSTAIFMEYAEKIIFNLVFLRSEINCVPSHLQYEKYSVITTDEIKREDAKVDSRFMDVVFASNGKPFLYYLLYLSSKNEATKANVKAKFSYYCMTELKARRRSDFLATALNMLGHVYELENRLPEAWTLYMTSVSLHCSAAYWHLFRLFGHVVYCVSC